MKNQRGYMREAIVFLLVIAAIAGMGALKVFDWLWPILKVWIHGITA